MKFLKLIGINVICFIALLGSFELLSKLLTIAYLSKVTRDQDWNIELNIAAGITHKKSDFDKNLNSKDSISKSIFYTKKLYGEKNSEKFGILTLGGSTTDPLGVHFSGENGTWPDHLGRKLSNDLNKTIVISNAGMGGSNSSQELYRLISSLGTVEEKNAYDLVISLNGANEIYFIDQLYLNRDLLYFPKLVHKSIERKNIIPINNTLYTKLYSSNTIPILKKILRDLSKNFGIKKTDDMFIKQNDELFLKASNIWERNIKMMYAVAKTRGIEYKVVLQPTAGLFPSKKINSNIDEIFNMTNDEREGYKNNINILYSYLRPKCQKLNFCIDLSNKSDLITEANYYADWRHLNSQGNEILAEYIINKIFK